MNLNCRRNISAQIGFRAADDANAMLTQRIIFALKDFRNAIAHNDVVFDTRFKSGKIDNQVCRAITNGTGVQNITFDSITDYLVLVIYLLKLLGISKTELRRIISDFEDITEMLRKEIPVSTYNRIVFTDNRTKLNNLRVFAKR